MHGESTREGQRGVSLRRIALSHDSSRHGSDEKSLELHFDGGDVRLGGVFGDEVRRWDCG